MWNARHCDREVRLDERIKTLKEAARLVCPGCASGIELRTMYVSGTAIPRHAQWRDDENKGVFWDCLAHVFHDRIAELEAERAGTPQEKNFPCAEQKNS